MRRAVLLALCTSAALSAQITAILGSGENQTAVARGNTLFREQCGTCHGLTARGDTAPALVRSTIVQNEQITSSFGNTHKPPFTLTTNQMEDLSAWLRVQIYAIVHRTTSSYQDIVTGDAKRGEQFFNGAGKCNSCHSPTGDLAGVGRRYDPAVLQALWINPSRRRFARGPAGTPSRSTITVKVGPYSGTLDKLDDFTVALRDSNNILRLIPITPTTKIEINDPLKAHTELIPTLTDQIIHDVTAYLVTLQ